MSRGSEDPRAGQAESPAAAPDAGRSWHALPAGLVFGLCTYLAFPPAGLWPLTFAAALVLIRSAWRGAHTPARSAVLFGLGSLPCWLSEQFWLVSVTPVGYPLLALYHAAFTGLSVYVLTWICRLPTAPSRAGARVRPTLPLAAAAPLAWLAVEFLRGELFLSGYAWFLLAHPLIGSSALAAPASVLGTYSVSALAAALCGAVGDLLGWSGRNRIVGIVGVAIVSILWAGSAAVGLRPPPGEESTLRVGIVQTNVPQGQKLNWTSERIASDFRRFIDLTRALAGTEPRPQVIVWPETMFPGVSLNDRAVEVFEAVFRANNPRAGPDDRSLNGAMVRILRDVQRDIGIPLFIGSKELIGARLERDADGRAEIGDEARYNSVVVVHEGRVLDERYDKVDLTPFGEFIPVAWRWPALQRLVLAVGAAGMRFDLAPGRQPASLTVPGASDARGLPVRAATPICFEVTRSGLCRRLAREAHLLINLSNDGWFGDFTAAPVPSDAGRAQHLLAARWRCVELGIPMVRSVNTGLSAAIDTRGQLRPLQPIVAAASPTRADGALVASVSIRGVPNTPFARLGNLAGWLIAGSGWLVFMVARLRPSRTGSVIPVP